MIIMRIGLTGGGLTASVISIQTSCFLTLYSRVCVCVCVCVCVWVCVCVFKSLLYFLLSVKCSPQSPLVHIWLLNLANFNVTLSLILGHKILFKKKKRKKKPSQWGWHTSHLFFSSFASRVLFFFSKTNVKQNTIRKKVTLSRLKLIIMFHRPLHRHGDALR